MVYAKKCWGAAGLEYNVENYYLNHNDNNGDNNIDDDYITILTTT